MTHAALKTIATVHNTESGDRVIGVDDDREVLGVEHDHLHNNDKFMHHLAQVARNGSGDPEGTPESTQDSDSGWQGYLPRHSPHRVRSRCTHSGKDSFDQIRTAGDGMNARPPQDRDLVGDSSFRGTASKVWTMTNCDTTYASIFRRHPICRMTC